MKIRTPLVAFVLGLVLSALLITATQIQAARESDIWIERLGSYIQTTWNEGRNVLINGTNKYLNFGSTSGSSGYGFRDNAGSMEFKNSGGAWAGISAGGGGGSSKWNDNGAELEPISGESIRVPFVTATSTTATSTFAGSVQIGSTARANALAITASTNYGTGASTGGLVSIVNTLNTSAGLNVYTNAGASQSSLGLVFMKQDNALADSSVLRLDNDGISNAIEINQNNAVSTEPVITISNLTSGTGLYINNASTTSTTGPVQIANTSMAPGILINQTNSSNSQGAIRIDSITPEIEMVETDQVTPNGKFEMRVQNNQWQVNSRNTADSSFERVMSLTSLLNGGSLALLYPGVGGFPVQNARLEVIGINTATTTNYVSVSSDTTPAGGEGTPLDDIFVIKGSTGNVGIGTSSPNRKLTVVGNGQFTSLASCDTIDTDINGILSCGTDSGGGSSNWTDQGTFLVPLTSTDGITVTGSSTFTWLQTASTTLTSTTTFGSLVASTAMFVNASKNATSTAPSSYLTTSLTDETGSGVAVFGTSPAFTTSVTTPSTSFTAWAGATTLLTIGGTGASASMFMPSTLDTTSSITGAIRTSGGISAAKALNIGTTGTFGTGIVAPLVTGSSSVAGVLTLKSTSGIGTSDRISMLVGNNGATEALRVSNNGNISIGTVTATSSRLTVAGASSGTILSLLSNGGTVFLDMLNTGVTTLLGEWNFGGATSLEIPNGTGPAVNTLGEIALDTTDNQLIIATSTTALAIPTITKIWGATIASTSADFGSGGRIPLPPHRDGVVITEVHCFVDGGTSKVINLDTMAGGAQLDSLTCGTTLTSDTAQSANNNLSAGALMALEYGATTGAVDYVTFSAWGFIIPE